MNYISSLFSKRWDLPKSELAKKAIDSFSITEKTLFGFFGAVFVISSIALLYKVNTSFMVEVPDRGGELSEGIIGSPRFVNPLLAMSDADKDITSLVYSGLMKVTADGTLRPDLAQEYAVSSDGLTYTFTLKSDATFHDGEPVTADDIIFTIEKAQDATLKSPKRGSWDGITVAKISDTEVQFILKQPYGPFLENTTLGILPKHIWKDATSEQFSFSEYNIEPIGSGPYRVKSVRKNSAGIPIGYTLKSFSDYALGEPYVSALSIQFYTDEKALSSALSKGDVESGYGLSAETAHALEEKGSRIEKSILPRTFAVFFNQSQAPVFANKEVRRALNASVNKDAIVSSVLFGYGHSIDGPIPTEATSADSRTEDERIAEATAILTKAGWTRTSTSSGEWIKKDKKSTQKLSFSIATGDAPELKAAAQMIVQDWTKLGAQVDLQIYETGDLNQNIIRPRKYDALFFGEVIGRNLDFYPFWHSSQRTDPGLNIATYVNSSVDKLLEDARGTSDESIRDKKYEEFASIIKEDQPVVFVYAPSFLYVLPSKMKGVHVGELTTPSERFANIEEWYIATSNIWNIFNKQ